MKTNLMTLATKLNEETGATGAELETMTHFAAMMFAAVVGNKEAESHFQKRMTESNARMHTEGNRA